jgi:dTDP-4-amino-4,6-dideoxygalactose transaminase
MILCSNPRAQYLAHREDIDRAVARVLASGRYVLGDEVSGFESEFAAYLGVRHAVAVASGTDALHIALRAAGIGPGDEVIAPSHTAVATVAAIELSGAIPVFADIEPAFFTLDPSAVERVVSERSRAVIAVHLYGQAADLGALGALCERLGLSLIEDCAQAHGASWQARKVGSVGRLACFSFYPTKNLGALGDGGLVATNDAKLFTRCRELREYGWNEKRESARPGLNSRLDEMQAAVLRAKLGHLDRDNAQRERIARTYDVALAHGPWRLPGRRPGTSHVFHQYVLRSDERDELLADLRARGVAAGIHYSVPVHRHPAYLARIRGAEALPETERAACEVLSLPIYPELEKKDVEKVIAAMLASGKGAS